MIFNKKRIWQIYADFAQILIKEAKPLYFNDKVFRPDLDNDINISDKTPVEPVL
jgi:hypothetical protein